MEAVAYKEELSPPPIDNNIIYPESDGEPMGETGFHVKANLHLFGALRNFFRNHDDIYVAADMFFYYKENKPKANKAPDVMVIKGVPNYERRTFKLWEEKAGPCVIFEVTSKSTMLEDMVTKRDLYAKLGVREYFLFDPFAEYLDTFLIGLRLNQKGYEKIFSDEKNRLFSKELNLFLIPENDILRIIDANTKKPIPSLEETWIWALRESERADKEAQKTKRESERADKEAQKAKRESERANKLAEKLKKLGIDPTLD